MRQLGDIQRREGRLAEDIRVYTHGLDEIERRTSIEPTSRVVEGQNPSASRHHLGDRHSLSLATGHATDELIADVRVRGVCHIQHLEQHVANGPVELLARDSRNPALRPGRLQREREIKSLGNREGSDVNVIYEPMVSESSLK